MNEPQSALLEALTESVAALAEKQALFIELLSAKLTLEEDDRITLVNSAQQNYKRAEQLREQLKELS